MLAVRMEANAAAEPVSSSTHMDMANRSIRLAKSDMPRPATSRRKSRVRRGSAAWLLCGSYAFVHRGFLSCDWPRPFIQTDRRSVIVITIRPRKKVRKRFDICDVRMCKMRRARARLLCGRCTLFRRQGRETFGRPQDERLVEHWHADGVEHAWRGSGCGCSMSA